MIDPAAPIEPPMFPATVAFASPVSTVAIYGEARAWDAPAVRIERVEGGRAVFRLATGPAGELGGYPLAAETLGGPATSGETPDAVAAEIAAHVLAPVSDEARLARAKARKITAINAALATALAAGITPEGAGFALAAVPAWRNKFTGLATIIQTALLGAADEPARAAILMAETPLVAHGGELHTITNAALLALLVSYGSQIQTLEVTTATRLAAVAAASDLAAVVAIGTVLP